MTDKWTPHVPLAAAVCYSNKGGKTEFLLVRTSSHRRWIFPRGHVEPGESLWQAAEREAREEAGVNGIINKNLLGIIKHQKEKTGLKVAVFLLKVEKLQEPQEGFRHPAWFGYKAAKKKLGRNRSWKQATAWRRILSKAFHTIKYHSKSE